MSDAQGSSVQSPLAAAHYADSANQYRVVVTENERLARDTYRVRFACPELAATIVPGQFLMLKLAKTDDPLLGRPFALYDTVLDTAGNPHAIDVVYLVVGKLTARLAASRSGDAIDVWGPLGNGFSSQPVEHLIMVAGGIGQTPFLALGREFLGRRQYGVPPRVIQPAKKVTLCYGVRSLDLLSGVEDFKGCGIDLQIASDDGSVGHHGLVTEVVEKVLTENSAAVCRIACCGPEKMMEAVAGIARAHSVPCEVSLETPMACGIGICFSCVVKTYQPDGDWDYKRTCVEGPVFDCEKIAW
ncbi:dihydroorotate dehydrogenase electron transfer subunit [Bythopirellula polymerisocia]|uniref:Dihydroorotate dehydrogenase B (NAD(+)), electron transfer subunit n=1 Tax=Bythopirellula polymerisocia TaxID=2528003 RepID=A0A5C6CBL6_9BACT|nr:dihydroorotate dehydrogenase electron transfer subunit [Bythopirellula polymerisocia]TWU20814.1 Dihydroorotate dehydrogenase B (NAD(+)), electron transfer subunit [Bythopirellula polymerisocia]